MAFVSIAPVACGRPEISDSHSSRLQLRRVPVAKAPRFSASGVFGAQLKRSFVISHMLAHNRRVDITASADSASVAQKSTSSVSSEGSWLTTGSGKIKLDDFRANLMRQEETIIFALIERAQFAQNAKVYRRPSPLVHDDFSGSFLDFLLLGTEKLHARMRRYTSPDEAAFFPDELPEPVLASLDYAPILRPNKINVGKRVMSSYIDSILPRICAPGDDNQYGSTACCDVTVLQALSKRIHFGKFIAEAKFQEDPEGYTRLIKARDEESLMKLLTNLQVEAKLLRRVRYKAWSYGRDISSDPESSEAPQYDASSSASDCKVDPQVVVDVYEKIIIPMTKDVEVLYLLERLDPPVH